MRIGILQTGRVASPLAERYGQPAQMFERFLERADRALVFETYNVLDNHFPDSIRDCDGWLITGSRHSVCEKLDWMVRLESFIREAYAARVPVVGICFGHQILAEALGGRVEKSAKGWGCGPHDYDLAGGGLAEPDRLEGSSKTPSRLRIQAMHEDQVVVKPPRAAVIASSAFCPWAGLAYEDAALSFQGHPEFDNAFVAELIRLRTASGTIPPEVAEPALAQIDLENDRDQVGRLIVAFFRKARSSSAAQQDPGNPAA